ncbi:hypothetical protein [Geopseudomonas aromaticivorans]
MKAYQLFFDTGESIFPDQARDKTALLLDQYQPGLVSALMNYETLDGAKRTIQGFPPVHFARNKKGFALVGFGDKGIGIIEDVYPALAKAWSASVKRQVRLEGREVEVGAEYRPYAMRYRVGRMVVQKTKEDLAKLASEASGRQHVEALLVASLRRQAEAIGVALPEKLEAKLVGSEGAFAAKLGHAGLGRHGMKGVTFDINLSLKGLWTFGYLLSKGHGLMNADFERSGGALRGGEVAHVAFE